MTLLLPGWHRTQFLRRIAAAALVLLALLLFLSPKSTISVATTSRAIPAGQHLSAADISWRNFPAELIPAEAIQKDKHAESLSAPDIIGATILSATTAGEIITSARLLNESTAAELLGSPDATLVPVTLLNKQIANTLRHGDTVSVVTSATDGSALIIAAGARVVAVQEGATLLLALAATEANQVAAAALNSPLTITITQR
ncbi:SAF domain-containing protein [Corynebacterium caspium]|uniref:SAF domain-containing protein n=1 Tax=Corynebacterium caspium TaxID=234828 RepID=UPI00036E2B2F|nr:SAF domain-containing protein [Corynebacterium caspium]WKD59623.1 SAF domain protein [Corynebacterium caspium DSM 44850]